MNSSIRLVFNKETCGGVQLDAADRLADSLIDNAHTSKPAPLGDYITIILIMASTEYICWLWLHTGVCVVVFLFPALSS